MSKSQVQSNPKFPFIKLSKFAKDHHRFQIFNLFVLVILESINNLLAFLCLFGFSSSWDMYMYRINMSWRCYRRMYIIPSQVWMTTSTTLMKSIKLESLNCKILLVGSKTYFMRQRQYRNWIFRMVIRILVHSATYSPFIFLFAANFFISRLVRCSNNFQEWL